MKEENAEAGFYVNTGRFANTAREYAALNQIELYDREDFPALVNSAFPVKEDISIARVMCLECGNVGSFPVGDAPASGVCDNGHQVTNDITTERIRRTSSSPVPDCKIHDQPMRLKDGRNGKFWSCPEYPNCKYTETYKPTSSEWWSRQM